MKQEKEYFEAYKTAHVWIDLKRFKKNPKVELVDTIDIFINGKPNFDKLEKLQKGYPVEKFMMEQDEFLDFVWQALRDNETAFEGYDYVVPCHISVLGDETMLSFDCFKKSSFWN